MGKDKDKENDVLTAGGVPPDEDAPSDPGDQETDSNDEEVVVDEYGWLQDRIADQKNVILELEGRIERLEVAVNKEQSASKRGDATILAGAIRALSALALSPDGRQSFETMCPFLFKE